MDKSIAVKLYSVYIEAYRPPKWVLSDNIWNKLSFARTCLYYDHNDSLDEVIKIATQREPVNMGMKRGYKQDKLNTLFGYKKGYYGEYVKRTGKFPPLIGIYAFTPVDISGGTMLPSFKYAHVINLIGLALDTEKQPDYQILFNKTIEDKNNAINNHYKRMWRMAFQCCVKKGLKYLHTSLVGGGAFSPNGTCDYIDNIYKPVIAEISGEYPMIELIETFYPKFVIPSSLKNVSQDKMYQTLYVNAWDPWSMIGNGNSYDDSLDGYWGRSSALCVLCSPQINTLMQKVPLVLYK